MGYTSLAIKSYSWVSLLRGMFRASGFIRTAFLARLLTPTQFGVFGIGAIVLGLVEMVTETGINVFFIQHTEPGALKKYLDTAFVVSIIRGIIISLLMVVSTPIVAFFFNSTQAIPILLLLALVPLVRGFINPAIVTFQKELQFRKDFKFKIIIVTTDALFAITFAVIYQSPISLGIGLLAGAVAEVILSHIYINPRPKFNYQKSYFSEIIHQGKWITSAGIASYFSLKLPDISIGRLLSTQALGLYQMAYRFAILPLEEIGEVINKVSFPLFVKISQDQSRLRVAFLKNASVYLIASSVYTVTLLICAPLITQIFLGSQWLEIIPLMRLLVIAGFLYSVNNLTNPLILALNRQKQLSHLTFIRLITILISILPLAFSFSIYGIVIALILSLITPLPYRFYLLKKDLWSLSHPKTTVQ